MVNYVKVDSEEGGYQTTGDLMSAQTDIPLWMASTSLTICLANYELVPQSGLLRLRVEDTHTCTHPSHTPTHTHTHKWRENSKSHHVKGFILKTNFYIVCLKLNKNLQHCFCLLAMIIEPPLNLGNSLSAQLVTQNNGSISYHFMLSMIHKMCIMVKVKLITYFSKNVVIL